MRLGVVGHEQAKFTSHTEALARSAIVEVIERLGAHTLISGHCPLGGVDIFAEEIATLHGLKMEVYAPKVNQWSGPGGYQARNMLIARNSDIVLCVALKDLPDAFTGLRHEGCYHCIGKGSPVPTHVKGGGCWTAWKCEQQMWAIIQEDEPPHFVVSTFTNKEIQMAFKVSSQTAAPAASQGAKPVGGRYAGIRPAPPALTSLKGDAEYILELVTHKLARSQTCTMIHCKVLKAEGENATPKSDETCQFFINFGGAAYDSGIARVVALAMAVCGAETVEQFWAEEPHGDELIDIICGKRDRSEHYGDNPLNGRKIYARGLNAQQLSKRGDPFVNWEFGVAAE